MGFVAGIIVGSGHAKADFVWTQEADMPTTRYVHSTSTVGGKIYAIGGYIGENHTTRTDEYDPMTGIWTRRTNMPTARGYNYTCVVNDRIYVLGGDVAGPISVVEVYDPATDTWQEQTEVPSPRYTPAPSVVDGVIYVMGGKGKTENLDWAQFPANMVDAYDPATDIWMRKADMPTARWMQSSCAINGKIYVIGGMTSGGVTTAVEEYDPMTDTWMVKAPMPTARCLFDTCVIDAKICAIGGWRDGPISTVEIYDPQTDTWTKGVDIPVPTEGLSASVVDGRIYVFGGWSSTYGDISAVYASEPIVDLNVDGIVDSIDMCIMIDHWGTDYSLCDIAPPPFGDGIVDVEDLKVLAEHPFEPVDDPTLIAHWALDETEGTVVADAVGDNQAYAVGDPVWHPDGGQVNGALEFDGVDDFISAPAPLNPADGPFSVLAWVKGGAPGQAIISEPTGPDWLALDPLTGHLMTEFTSAGRGAAFLLSEAVIADGGWHRVGFVWDGLYRTLYVDGAAVAEDTQNGLANPGNGFYIGTGKDVAAGTHFSGLIDDVRIYNRAVSP
ncbi:MAG: Kelch repeat-containing protein [Planctomycetota bacterium]